MARDLKAMIVIGGKVAASLGPAFSYAEKHCSQLTKAQSFASKAAIGFGKVAGTAILGGTTAMAAGLTAIAVKSIGLASDLNEVQNVVDTTFGSNASAINAWAKKASASYGETELQAKQFTGTMGAMLKSMGLSQGQYTQMSEKLSGLAGDFASFYNLPIEDAFDKIRSGMSGETEPLKQLGINMSDANLQAFALSQGIKKSYTKMDAASKSSLRYAYLMKVSKDAQGDFLKTSNSFANQQRILKNNLDATFASFGQQLLPLANQGLQQLNKLLNGGGLGAFLSQLTPLVQQMMPTFVSLLNFIGSSVAPQLFGLLSAIFQQVIIPLLPVLMQFVQAVLPPLVAVLSVIISLISQLLPILGMIMPIITMLMPFVTMLANVIGGVLGSVIQALLPLIQSVCNLLGGVLGPILTVLTPIFQVFGDMLTVIANIFGGVFGEAIQTVMPVLQLLSDILTFVMNLIQPILNGISAISSSTPRSTAAVKLPGYAEGGLAMRPSIFGERGPEFAIPAKNSPRARMLAAQAARATGLGSGVQVTYAPVIQGGNTAEIAALLEEDKPRFGDVLTSVLSDQGRLSYG